MHYDGKAKGVGVGHGQGRAVGRGPGRVAVLGLLLLVISGGWGDARRPGEDPGSLGAFATHLSRRVPSLMRQYGVPGVCMALVRGGALVWSGAFGYADRERGRPMTVDAVFRVESISKSVTAWGVMKLVEQGLVGLDDPVQQYLGDWELPGSEYPWHEVTVRRLLSHTAGLALGTIGNEYAPQSRAPSLQEHLAHEARLVQAPGAGFLYSNPGFNLLELLIEGASGQDFAEYMADEVLNPLGMGEASFDWSERLRPLIPTAYDLQGKPVPFYVQPARAAGGLMADAEGIARFVGAAMTRHAFGGQAVLGQESLGTLHTPEAGVAGMYGVVADGYGFGHFVEELPDGRRAVWHGGQGHGWMTHFHAVPESGDGIVILTNSQRSWPLMAQVLSDWAAWSGLGSVKMGRITYAVTALRVLVGVVLLLALWQVYRLGRDLRGGVRRWAPFARESWVLRLLEAVVGTGAIAALVWAAAQPYLAVAFVFPVTANRAGFAFFLLAVSLVASALLPQVRPEDACRDPREP